MERQHINVTRVGTRSHLIIIYPSENKIYHNGDGGTTLDCIAFVGYMGIMSYGSVCIYSWAEKVVYVKPSLKDIQEFSNKLIEYRKKKELVI